MVFVFDTQSEKILMVENLHSWSLPGGKREEGESLQNAAIREAREEAGLEVEIDELVNLNEQIAEKHVLFFRFRGRIIGGNLRIMILISSKLNGWILQKLKSVCHGILILGPHC